MMIHFKVFVCSCKQTMPSQYKPKICLNMSTIPWLGDVALGQYLFSEKLSTLLYIFFLFSLNLTILNFTFSFKISCNTPITNLVSLSFNQITNPLKLTWQKTTAIAVYTTYICICCFQVVIELLCLRLFVVPPIEFLRSLCKPFYCGWFATKKFLILFLSEEKKPYQSIL